jgi:nucleoside-diphosphate-sugar epimerase
MATYLITGGAGFIGSSIADELLKQGERVRIIDDLSTGREQNLTPFEGKVELFRGSITDADLINKAAQGVEAIFHQAAIPSVARSVEAPTPSLNINVVGTTMVLDAARRHGVRRVLFAASSSAYGNTKVLPKVESMTPEPLSPYAVSKACGEQLLRVFGNLYGIETLSLRYFNVFGPKQDPTSQYAAVIPNFITAALRRERPMVHGDGEQTRDFCYIKNVVRANLLGATTKNALRGDVINIACGERISLNQLLAIIGDEAGVKVEANYGPERAGDVRDSLADISRAQELIGYVPTHTVRQGIKETFAAFKTFTK